mgnify:CR=1 FL=1
MQILAIITTILIISSSAEAAISIGLSGAASQSNYSLETQKSSILSANVSLGIASFLRIGFTHRRSFQEKSGLKKSTSDSGTIYYEFEDNTDIVTNSVDLTAILYPGRISPFVFGGVARRDYYTEVRYPGSESKGETTLPAVPNYGLGFAVQLNRSFSLKITRTYTPGITTSLEDGEEVDEVVNDTYTQLGISYRI